MLSPRKVRLITSAATSTLSFLNGLLMALLLLVVVRGVCAQETEAWRVTKAGGLRFATVDVFVDSGAHPLAAYQILFASTRGDVRIVGIEGGEHPAFKEAPYYDPKAIQQERAIIAAFNTAPADRLPKGRTRVATIHVQVSGATRARYALKLQAAGTSDGQSISVETSFQERNTL